MRGSRRKNRELVLSRSSRERWYVLASYCLICIIIVCFDFLNIFFSIHRAGFSIQEVANVMRQVRKDRHSRLVSAQQIGLDDLHEAKEKFTQGIKKFLFKKSNYELSLKEACTSVKSHGNISKY
jgi:hypothetical protein